MTEIVAAEMQQRRGTAAAWTAANPVLLDGEIGIEKDTRNIKIGDGVTPWNTLAYAVQLAAYVSQTQTEIGLFGATASVRIPFTATPKISGPAAVASGTSNVVGWAPSPALLGDFTGIGGSDPGFAWGMDLFVTVGDGTLANDVKGLTTITGGELELDILNTTGTIAVARGGSSGVFLFGAAAGATITQAEGFRAMAPARVSGATGGSVTNAYSLFVEDCELGTSSNFSLYVAGGVNRILGRLDVGGTIVSVGGALILEADFSAAANIVLQNAANGGNATLQLGASSAGFFVKTSGGTTGLEMDGLANALLGINSPATNAGNGFPYLPANAGAPTGTPTGYTGRVPMYYDTTNHKIWIYDAGWKGVVVA